MADAPVTFASMHAEHRLWQSEHSMWNDDISRWREQYEAAASQLQQLQSLVRRHGEGLDAHTQTIHSIQRSSEQHEKSIAGYIRDGEDAEGQEAMCKNHRLKAQRHDEQRALHEQIKKRHHTMMAHLAILQAAIDAAT